MGNAALTSAPSHLGTKADAVIENGAGAWRVLPLEGFFRFSYRDASGRPSRRRVSAHELKMGSGKMLLGGTDLGTGAYRGFRVDRIRFLEDVDSGTVIGHNVLDWLFKTATDQDRARRRAATAAKRDRRHGLPFAPTDRP